ncbi:MAG: ABC transporter ATP-binding protein [Acidobacteria bacterium]|nr:ABC transporter ATP-binding protein [Acidobacteriota bacterium]MBI3427851.1 ABC transporter ATP-binding protein [Acidobacteriota bacterium]
MEQSDQQPAIQVRGLRKSFGEQVVLNGIDLNVARGETLTVLGRSGTGKSVLLKLIIGLQKPDGGGIEINGEEITALPLDELNEVRKKVGFLFQQAALYDSMTVAENVAFPLRWHTRMEDEELRRRVRELLARVGMEEASAKLPADISGGMKKRVGLARALALDPEIMLLDEPTAGLDPITANEIDELIRQLQQERRISSVIVTHDMRSVKLVADRIVMLNEGNIVTEGTLADLQRSGDSFVKQFLREAEGEAREEE